MTDIEDARDLKRPGTFPPKLVLILLLSLAIQACVATLPTPWSDVLFFRIWCRKLVTSGLAAAYWETSIHSTGLNFYYPVNHPPVYPYFLFVIGHVLDFVNPSAFRTSDRVLDFFIKVSSGGAILAIACLLFIELRRRGKHGAAMLAAAACALNPALVLDACYWGQIDSFYALLLVAALILAVRGKPEWAWVCLTLGVLTKLLALPLAPLLAIYTFQRFGTKRLLTSFVASIGTFFLVFAPFLWIGRFMDVLRTTYERRDIMPYASVNAHNLWWIIGRAQPWVLASDKLGNTISYQNAGLLLFGLAGLLTVIKLWKSPSDRFLTLAFAGVSFAFFMLYTHMHENHLLVFFPLFSLACFEDRRLKRIYMILTVTSFMNLVLHDPFLPFALKLYDLGPQLVLLAQPNLDPAVLNYAVSQGDRFTVEQTLGHVSLFWLILTILNAQLNLLVFAFWTFHYPRWDFEGHAPLNLRLKSRLIFILLFVVLTGWPTVQKALNYQREPPVRTHNEAVH